MNNNIERKNTSKHKGKYNSMIEDNELPLSPYKNYANTNNNYPDIIIFQIIFIQ